MVIKKNLIKKNYFTILRLKNCNRTANKTIEPPNKTTKGGVSLINNHAQRGPKIASVNIMIPTIAEGVVLAPIVININPNPT